MFFELALLGAAYFGSNRLREDGALAARVRDITGDAAERVLDIIFPSSMPTAKPVASKAPPPPPPNPAPLHSEGEDNRSAVAIRRHYCNVSLFSAGAIALRTFVPLAGVVGYAAYVYGLAPHLGNVEKHLREKRSINVDTLFLLADVLALLSGSHVAAASSLYLIQAGRMGVTRAKDAGRRHIQHLFRDLPDKVWAARDGVEVEVPLASIVAGDILAFHSGSVIPVDGTVVDGFAAVDQSTLTGESIPVDKGPGDVVLANTFLISGRILVRVERSGSETTAGRIADIILHSVDSKSDIQLRGEQWADALTRPMFYTSLALLPFLGAVSTSVFINSHIGMRIRILAPMSTLKHISAASKRGLLIKDGRALEKYLEIDAILFDKTGTLTDDAPEVSHIFPAEERSADEVLRYAAIAERKLSHPIAKAIVNKAREAKIAFPDIDDSRYSIGYGIRVECQGEVIRVGSPRYLADERIAISGYWNDLRESEEREGRSMVFVAVGNRLVGALRLEPRLRREMRTVIADLRQRGIKHMAIVSGDTEAPTRRLADELGMDGWYAEALPEDKAEIVARLQAQGYCVCFVGDGINDTPALKRADVSVSLAGAGTAARDMAEIVLMDSHVRSLADLHEISAKLGGDLQSSLNLSVAPGVINCLGAFVLNFSTLTSLLINAGFGFWGAFRALPHDEDASTAKKETTIEEATSELARD